MKIGRKEEAEILRDKQRENDKEDEKEGNNLHKKEKRKKEIKHSWK